MYLKIPLQKYPQKFDKNNYKICLRHLLIGHNSFPIRWETINSRSHHSILITFVLIDIFSFRIGRRIGYKMLLLSLSSSCPHTTQVTIPS